MHYNIYIILYIHVYIYIYIFSASHTSQRWHIYVYYICAYQSTCKVLTHGSCARSYAAALYIILADAARLRRTRCFCCGVVEKGSPYSFSVKPKCRTVIFWFFVGHSSSEAYLRTSPPRGHSTVGVPKRCEGFVAIWLRAREEFADNRFQLLFI